MKRRLHAANHERKRCSEYEFIFFVRFILLTGLCSLDYYAVASRTRKKKKRIKKEMENLVKAFARCHGFVNEGKVINFMTLARSPRWKQNTAENVPARAVAF